MKDEVFCDEIVKQFEFDEKVVRVFDDMVTRSVPYYSINQELIADIAGKICKKNARILDLGCSTANTLLEIAKRAEFELFGLDNSISMIEKAQQKAQDLGVKIEFLHMDIEQIDELEMEFDLVICSYTLHFIRPLKRLEILKKINAILKKGGCLILCEKVLFENKILQKNIIDIYENYKNKMGYSRYEIAQKRAALENVLIPFTSEENLSLLKNAGFIDCDSIFRWANFCSFIAFKE